jgi:RNA polymerase sigma-70 factor (ECF subfamily)
MSLVTAGDLGAMGTLYEKYKRSLYLYFLKVTLGNIHTSEDLVHTVFYRAIKYRSTFRRQGSFASWLFSIAHNVCLDQHKPARSIIEYRPDLLQAVPPCYDDKDETDEKNENLETLKKAMAMLEAGERELVILCKIDCLLYADVAEILGISEGNVKVRLFRAIRKLREIFKKLEKCRYEEKE